MFISDDLIFLQLQKAAGTHIAALLMEHLSGRMEDKHSALKFGPGNRMVIGSVRNPWDWYVSLWSYGCGNAGGVQGLLKGSHMHTSRRILRAAWRKPADWGGALQDLRAHATRDVAFWHDVYANPDAPVRFRRCLTALLSAKGRCLLDADYAMRQLAEFAGFYTYRFLSVFTPVATWGAYADAIRRREDIAPFFARNCAVSMLIRTESLEEDLAQVFARLGRPKITATLLRGDRINASRRGKAESYYDDATLKLVADSDPFMVSQFGYAPPGGTKR